PETSLREVAFGERQNLYRNHLEDQRLAAFALECAVRHLEVPVTVVLGFPCAGEPVQENVVGDPLRASFDHYVESGFPSVVPGGERAVRVPRQVDALLLAGAGTKVERGVAPHRGNRSDVGATVRSDRRDPEELGLVDDSANVRPR